MEKPVKIGENKYTLNGYRVFRCKALSRRFVWRIVCMETNQWAQHNYQSKDSAFEAVRSGRLSY